MQVGETLQAWRMNKYWYYGELVSGALYTRVLDS
jgi:hypothetical protein